MIRRGTRLLALAIASGASVVCAAGSAYAYYQTQVVGSVSAVATSQSSFSVTTTSTQASTSSKLLPGRSADVVIRVSNPNLYPVQVTALTLGAAAPDAGHSGCTTTGITITQPSSLSAAQFTIAKAVDRSTPTVANIVLSGAASMNALTTSAGASPGCMGASFSIPVTLTAQG